MPRITVLGGSSVSSVGLALALRPLAAREELVLTLHGRNMAKLDAVARASAVALGGTPARVDGRTDLAESLEGADVVLLQVRVGGLEGRRFDESFPRELGLVAEETLGAGGFSNALRTVPVVLELARAIESAAPGARVVNLTNPASIVHQAITRYTNLRAVSVCDVPVTLRGWVADVLGRAPQEIEIDYFGTNHLGWVVRARDDGRDRLDEVLERLDELQAYPLPAAWARALRVLPGPYLRYLYRPEAFLGSPGSPTRADELLEVEAELVDRYAALDASATSEDVERIVSRRAPHWYEEIVVPALEAFVSDEPRRLVVQIANGATDPLLPHEQTIELPAWISRTGVEPEPPPPLPADCRAVLNANAVYERFALEAIVERSRDKALRALVANPLVGGIAQAEAVLDRVWVEERAGNHSQLEGVR